MSKREVRFFHRCSCGVEWSHTKLADNNKEWETLHTCPRCKLITTTVSRQEITE